MSFEDFAFELDSFQFSIDDAVRSERYGWGFFEVAGDDTEHVEGMLLLKRSVVEWRACASSMLAVCATERRCIIWTVFPSFLLKTNNTIHD